MLKDLSNLVSIPSISVSQDDSEYPFGSECYRAMSYCLDLCQKYGMKVKKCSNYLGYAEIGEGNDLMGILVHVDVVPPGDGWEYEPFYLTETEDKVYGRGVIDDKGPAILCIHAMKDIIDSGTKLNKRVRLIFGCSEENGNWKDMDYYKANEELPDYGFTADGDFPLVHAEMGMITLELSMEKTKSGLLYAEGGYAPNIVPNVCKIVYLDEGKKVEVNGEGVSAHGSTPWKGVNAIGKAMEIAKGAFAEFYNDCLGMEWNGKSLDCYLEDEISGTISVNPGIIRSTDDNIILTLDIRHPISFTYQEIIDRISKRAKPYNVTVNLTSHENPVYVNKEEPYIKKMLEAYRSVTGDMTEPIVMGGGTYAKAMDNIVAFGPNFPGDICTEHQPNEMAYTEQLYKAREIYRRAIELCQLYN